MKHLTSALLAVLISAGTPALAAKPDAPMVKWNQDVGAVIKPISVEVGSDLGGGRIVTITYEALKQCRNMAVTGYPYLPDGVQLSGFIFGRKFDVHPGQKFREQFLAASGPGSYLMLEKASCY